jgi:hypothetical protein
LDQLAHILLIALLAWVATGWRFSDLQILLTEDAPGRYRIMAYLIGLAILIGTVPILEAEITVAVWAVQGQEINYTLGIYTSDRVLGGLERMVAMTLILTGYGLVAPLLFLPRLAFMIYQGQAKDNRTAVVCKVITSFIATLIISAVLTYIPFPAFDF